MSDFVQEFTIHPVGQGLFYSGKITYKNQVKFRMVFDCGSLTANGAQPEVDRYRDPDFLQAKVLDLLVISHFDADHVNQIGQLLADGIKIKKLVMPVVSFEERLFLVAQYIDRNGRLEGDDFGLRCMIDPLTALGNSLDDDSDIYLVESGNPEEPIFPGSNIASDLEVQKKVYSENRFDFDFSNRESIPRRKIKDFSPPVKGNVYKVSDRDKANMSVDQYVLMDFLFYRRSVGEDEEAFFSAVRDLFAGEYNWDGDLKDLIKIVKSIRSAKKIREIFREAKKLVKPGVKKDFDVVNPNTTSLCMLHLNLPDIFTLMGYQRPEDGYFDSTLQVMQTHRFFSSPEQIVEIKNHMTIHPYYWYYHEKHRDFFCPNTLLTSDAFLLTQDQVTGFLNHYKNHWDEFWLFQVPHHGSKKNSDRLLHAHIPTLTSHFINYGTRNRHKHPSPEVVQDLMVTGQANKLIPVNEFQGLKFRWIC